MTKRLNETTTMDLINMSTKDTLIVTKNQFNKIKTLVTIGQLQVTNLPKLQVED